ncbi:hypothetical protein [Nonomuraea sp. B19D2]|uniref:hypothetical protein n=1 Tax=Nonomuraea sp. B19D2 TaxID=3159561 RepID=UPI0032DB93AC
MTEDTVPDTTLPEPSMTAEQLTIVPANEASWDDLAAIFGTDAGRCQCQRFKVVGWIWRDSTQEQRTAMLRAQTACGDPDAAATSGLVAYVGDEPAGWVAVEPRTAYPKLRTSRVPWAGRAEDKDDDGVWAVTCFVIRKGYRGRGRRRVRGGQPPHRPAGGHAGRLLTTGRRALHGHALVCIYFYSCPRCSPPCLSANASGSPSPAASTPR